MSAPLTTFEWWETGTTQPSIPVNNNALRTMIGMRSAVSDSVTAQPSLSTPTDDGLWYVIPSGATGAQWSTFSQDSCAIFFGGNWYEFTPEDGDIIGIDGVLYTYSGSSGWVSIGGGGGGVSSVNGDTGAVIVPVPIGVACSDETTALTTGAAKATFRMPFAMNLTAVRASVTTAPTGSVLTVDINESGASILSTKITIDATEKTSTTAVTPPVISESSLADDSEITIDIDTVGSTIAGTGLKVWLIGYPS
jgi:hypothetical protein